MTRLTRVGEKLDFSDFDLFRESASVKSAQLDMYTEIEERIEDAVPELVASGTCTSACDQNWRGNMSKMVSKC